MINIHITEKYDKHSYNNKQIKYDKHSYNQKKKVNIHITEKYNKHSLNRITYNLYVNKFRY